jgi:hypothetical protein
MLKPPSFSVKGCVNADDRLGDRRALDLDFRRLFFLLWVAEDSLL